MTYSEKLAEINARIGTTNIKGKDYAEVNQRILAFWELFPEGRIVTEKLEDTGSRCDFIARVYSGDHLIATGHAFEEKKGTINSTSYIENCETSAVGRALGMLGIGATKALASAEEVASAIAQQNAKEEPSEDYMKPVREWWPHFEKLFISRDEALQTLLKAINADSMKSLTPAQAGKAAYFMSKYYNEHKEG